jgi:hypothetical protein
MSSSGNRGSNRYGGATTTTNSTTNNNTYTFSPSAFYNPEVNESKRHLVSMDPKRRHEYSSTSYAPTKSVDDDDDNDDYDAANYDAMPLEDQRRVALEEAEENEAADAAAAARNSNEIPFLQTRNGIITLVVVTLLVIVVIVVLVVTRRGSSDSKSITGFPTFSPIALPTPVPSKFLTW